MPTPLDALNSFEAAQAAVHLALRSPGRAIWAGLDGESPNPFFDTRSVGMIERWLLDDHRAELQILVARDRALLAKAPALVTLARRLSSRVGIRVLDPEAEDFSGEWHIHGEWFLSDAGAVVYRINKDSTAWQGSANAPMEMRRLQKNHAGLWEHALPSSETRSLSI